MSVAAADLSFSRSFVAFRRMRRLRMGTAISSKLPASTFVWMLQPDEQ